MSVTLPDDIRLLVDECMTAGGSVDEHDVLRTALILLAGQAEDIRALRTALHE